MSKYGVFSGPFFPVFEPEKTWYPNTRKYGPEKTPYLDTFHAVFVIAVFSVIFRCVTLPGQKVPAILVVIQAERRIYPAGARYHFGVGLSNVIDESSSK